MLQVAFVRLEIDEILSLYTMNILDLLFPKFCVGCRRLGAYICKSCFEKIVFTQAACPICRRMALGGKTHPYCQTRYGLDGLVCPTLFGPITKNLIHQLKYRLVSDLTKRIADLFFTSPTTREQLVSLLSENTVLVPVPLHQKREKWRGFNQSQVIAGELSRRTGIKVVELLARLVNTRPQVELSGKNRMKNVAGVFAIKDGIGLKDQTYLLVDDLLTTGSTMGECAKVLKKAGARRVWAVAVVRT